MAGNCWNGLSSAPDVPTKFARASGSRDGKLLADRVAVASTSGGCVKNGLRGGHRLRDGDIETTSHYFPRRRFQFTGTCVWSSRHHLVTDAYRSLGSEAAGGTRNLEGVAFIEAGPWW